MILAVNIEPELLSAIGIVITALIGVIAYAIVRTTRATNLDVDVADIMKLYQKALEQLANCNELKVTLLTLQNDNQTLTLRLAALEAEADRIERVRTENVTLKSMLTKLRNRVTKLEQYLQYHGLDIPNGDNNETAL